MNRRLLGAAGAATFALGILTGAAGTIVVRDVTTPDVAGGMADHMTDMGSMMSMMGGSMMPSASTMPNGEHERHHPEPTR